MYVHTLRVCVLVSHNLLKTQKTLNSPSSLSLSLSLSLTRRQPIPLYTKLSCSRSLSHHLIRLVFHHC
ncbi:hypothetical protein Hanom_Chr00s000001g01593721 [Helianthus anomalus]